LEPRDWTLLAIAAGNGEALSPVQLQKSLFLLGEMKLPKPRPLFYDFVPFSYGPLDPKIYRDAEALADLRLVTIQTDRWKAYAITPQGQLEAERIKQCADPGAADYLERVVAWARSLSFQELVKAIYARFPAYRANSIFQFE
jgi:uncharacterized phage-associated protein